MVEAATADEARVGRRAARRRRQAPAEPVALTADGIGLEGHGRDAPGRRSRASRKSFGPVRAVDDLTLRGAPGSRDRLPRARTAPARPRRCGCCSGSPGRLAGSRRWSATGPYVEHPVPASRRRGRPRGVQLPSRAHRARATSRRTPPRPASSRARCRELIEFVGLGGGGRPSGRRLLDGDAPAARPRDRAAGRPAGDRPRRAGQRPRPRGHRLAARPAARVRRRGPHRAGLEPRARPRCSTRSTTS